MTQGKTGTLNGQDRLRAVFCWDDLVPISGVKTFLLTCARRLPAFGVEPHFVTLRQSPTAQARREFGNVHDASRRRWHTPVSYHQSVVEKIASCQPHVLICNNEFGGHYLPTFGGRLPVMEIVHIDHPHEEEWEAVRLRLANLVAIVAVSDRIAQRFNEFPEARGKVQNITYGVEGDLAPRHPPGPDGPWIVYVGRFVQRHKRIRDLEAFLEALSASSKPFRMTVVGDGPERPYVEECVRRFAPRAEYAGSVPPDRVQEFYRRAHYCVQFSEFEGLSLVLLEAMAHGAVPVVTDIESGVRQLVHEGRTGFLFPVGQPAAAANKIMASADRWQELSQRAHSIVNDQFGIDRMCKRYADLLRQYAGPPLSTAPRYVDVGYSGLKGIMARRCVPCGLYQRVLGGYV